MPTTDASVQALLVAQVGDTDDGLLSSMVATTWGMNADKAKISPRLQWLYTKRDLIDLALGANRERVDFGGGQDLTFKAHQKIDTLNTMRVQCEVEIGVVEKKARANRIGQTAPITTVEPVTPPVYPESNPYPDALGQRTSGSPYLPLVRPVVG